MILRRFRYITTIEDVRREDDGRSRTKKTPDKLMNNAASSLLSGSRDAIWASSL